MEVTSAWTRSCPAYMIQTQCACLPVCQKYTWWLSKPCCVVLCRCVSMLTVTPLHQAGHRRDDGDDDDDENDGDKGKSCVKKNREIYTVPVSSWSKCVCIMPWCTVRPQWKINIKGSYGLIGVSWIYRPRRLYKCLFWSSYSQWEEFTWLIQDRKKQSRL